jgi:hypothetical protein
MHKAYDICVATFRIVANPSYPNYTNVEHVMLDPAYQPINAYPPHLQAHNLCESTTHIPPNLLRTLGLGLGFCLSLQREDAANPCNIDRLTRDICLCFHIKNDDNNSSYNPKLYVQNEDWQPDNAPDDAEAGIKKFATAINQLYSDARKARHQYNIPPNDIETLRQVK